jgi:ankyrin repeat protein
MVASNRGYVRIVLEFLEKHDMVHVNAGNDDGDTALTCASSAGHDQVVIELLNDYRVDVNAKGPFGKTA